MKRLSKISCLLIALTLLGLSACGGGSPASTPTVDSASIFTQIASTALALQTQTVLAMPTATSTPQVTLIAQTTNNPLITATPLPGMGPASATPLALTTPLASSQTSCDNMKYIADVTIPDGYVAAQGEVLKKTWTVQNLGPCTWNQNYSLIFGWGGQGTDWNTTQPAHLAKVVAPGENIDITVPLTAPSTPGEYVGTFKLQNDKGGNFPPGQQLTTDIVVK
jgi:hypothetical protein